MFGLFKKKAPAQSAPPVLRADQLQPRIKHLNFLKALQAGGVPPEHQPSHAPLCGELIVTYAFDLPDSLMMATPGLVESAGVSEPRLLYARAPTSSARCRSRSSSPRAVAISP